MPGVHINNDNNIVALMKQYDFFSQGIDKKNEFLLPDCKDTMWASKKVRLS